MYRRTDVFFIFYLIVLFVSYCYASKLIIDDTLEATEFDDLLIANLPQF